MNEDIIRSVYFFHVKYPIIQDKKKNFIALMCQKLKKIEFNEGDIIFSEGDPAKEIFFIYEGKISYIIPQYDNFQFLKIQKGYYFGEIDILFNENVRKYTVQACRDSIVYRLSKKDFKSIFFNEFKDVGMALIDSAMIRAERMEKIFKEANEFCTGLRKSSFAVRTSQFSSKVMNEFRSNTLRSNKKIQTFLNFHEEKGEKSDAYIKQLIEDSKMYEIEALKEKVKVLEFSIVELENLTVKLLKQRERLLRKEETRRVSIILERKLSRRGSSVTHSPTLPLNSPNERFLTFESRCSDLQRRKSIDMLSPNKGRNEILEELRLRQPFFTPKNSFQKSETSIQSPLHSSQQDEIEEDSDLDLSFQSPLLERKTSEAFKEIAGRKFVMEKPKISKFQR